MVEIQGDAFLFGGYGGYYNAAIYQLTCSSGICSWSKLNQQLKVARDWSVAIPVPDNFCKGKEGMLDLEQFFCVGLGSIFYLSCLESC